MLEILRYLDIGIVIFFAIMIVYYLGVRKNDPAKGEVRLPYYISAVGSVCGILFGAAAIASSFSAELWVVAGFNLFMIAGTGLSLAPVMIKTTYNKDYVIKRDLFGIKRTYCWEELTGLEDLHGDVRLWFGKKKLSVDELYIGAFELTAFAEKQYRRIHGSEIPLRQASRHSLFKGHVKNPGGFIFLYIVMYLLLIGIASAAIYSLRPIEAKDLVFENINVSKYEYSGDDLLIYAGDEIPYVIKDFTKYDTEIERVTEIVKTDADVKIGFIGHEDSKEDPRRDTYYLASEKGVELSVVEQSNERSRNELTKILIFTGSAAILWTAYCVLSVIVGRNPDKFNHGFVRLFFKDGYIY